MNNIDEMIREFQTEMLTVGMFNDNQVSLASSILSRVANKYNVEKVGTDLIAYGEIPKEVMEYLATLKLEGRTEATLYNYQIILNGFFTIVKKPLNEITHTDIWSYLLKYQESRPKPVSNRTMEEYRSYISCFFKWLHDMGYITKNPTAGMKPIKYEKKERKSMSRRDLVLLLNACETPRERAIIQIAYSTGCRISELCSMRKLDVNWHSKEILVVGKGNKERTVLFNDSADVSLRQYLDSRHDDSPYLFVSARGSHSICTHSMRRAINKVYDRAGVENISVPVTPHVIRHTTATLAIQSGMPVTSVQKLLGHEQVNTTMQYIDMDKIDIHDQYNRSII